MGTCDDHLYSGDGNLADGKNEIFACTKSGIRTEVRTWTDSRMKEDGDGDISSFSSLMTELAATIGTGNIVGVATAMVLGGPGALLWMMLSALTGFSTKFAESMLSVKYRVVNEQGKYRAVRCIRCGRHFQTERWGSSLAHCLLCLPCLHLSALEI